MTDVLTDVHAAVLRLQSEQDALLAACTDPEGTDVAELLYAVQQARITLQQVERDVETACAQAMLGDLAETPTLRVERHRTQDRKTWAHDEWQRDVRAKALQATGLKGAQGVVTADGEVASADSLYALLQLVQGAHGSTSPRLTNLRSLGLDPDDYCERSPGRWAVKVQRMADETEQEEVA